MLNILALGSNGFSSSKNDRVSAALKLTLRGHDKYLLST